MSAESYLSRGVSPTKDDVKAAVKNQNHALALKFQDDVRQFGRAHRVFTGDDIAVFVQDDLRIPEQEPQVGQARFSRSSRPLSLSLPILF